VTKQPVTFILTLFCSLFESQVLWYYVNIIDITRSSSIDKTIMCIHLFERKM